MEFALHSRVSVAAVPDVQHATAAGTLLVLPERMSSVRPLGVDPPRLVPLIHADDCGLSEGITDAIVACHDHGWLRRTSVVVNGAAWEHAVRVLSHRDSLSVVLHLNLFEGAPVSSPRDVNLLVDQHGRFCRRFGELWARGMAGADAVRL